MATATTTWRLITNQQVTVIRGLTPTSLSSRKFSLLKEDLDFEDWLLTNPSASLRRIHVEDSTVWESPLVWNVDYRQLTGGSRIRIAYPRNYGEYGRAGIRSANQVIDEDVAQIISNLERPSNYVSGQHSCNVSASPPYAVGNSLVADLDCSFIYYRSS